jgi:hypothetical protein
LFETSREAADLSKHRLPCRVSRYDLSCLLVSHPLSRLKIWKAFTYTFPSIPRYQEGDKHKVAGLDVPPGWEALAGPEGFHGITQQDVVRSAVTTYAQVGNKPLSQNPFADTGLLTDPNSISHWTPSRPGVFNIAVDPDMSNKFLSSLNSGDGRVYPCEAGGPNPFVPGSDKNYDEETRARHYAEFVDFTLLSLSPDYMAECTEYDRMRCVETEYDVRPWYSRTNTAHLSQEHVRYSFRNCRLPKGHQSDVGKTQCQKQKLDC